MRSSGSASRTPRSWSTRASARRACRIGLQTGSRSSPARCGSCSLHVLWFGLWIGLGVEHYPYGLLTMIVSLEAIFLSTFVMISQNRADAKRQVIANQQWQTVKEEDKQNEELLELSNQILELTQAIHKFTSPQASNQFGGSDDSGVRQAPAHEGPRSPDSHRAA